MARMGSAHHANRAESTLRGRSLPSRDRPRSHRADVTTTLAALGVVAIVALLWGVRRRLGRLEQQVKELRLMRREVDELRGDVDARLAVTRAHLAQVASGDPPDA